MDILKDIWASLVSGVKDRTTNPLTFAFILSWSIWNYKFFMVLTGDGTTTDKLSAIERMYPQDQSIYMGAALMFPLATAVIYVFIYPFISESVIRFYRGKQVELANTLRHIEGTRVLTHDEAITLTRRHETERKSWEERESSLDIKVNDLRNALDASEQQLAEQDKKSAFPFPSADDSDIVGPTHGPEEEEGDEDEEENNSASSDDQTSVGLTHKSDPTPLDSRSELMRILGKLSNSPLGLNASSLATSLRQNYSVMLESLEEIKEQGLIEKGSVGRWVLTRTGRKIIVNAIKSGDI